MVVPFTQFVTGLKPPEVERRPLLNAIPFTSSRSRILFRGSDYRRFWDWFKRTPELMATVNIPITDILGDRLEWTDLDGKPLDKNEIRKAKKFWRDNRGKEAVRSWLYDAFVTGDAYMWMGAPSTSDIVDVTKEFLKGKGVKMNKIQVKSILTKTHSNDEILTRPRMFMYMASSTVQILNDRHDIVGYRQNASGFEVLFDPKEIIHYRFMTLDGRVQGFSPIESLSSEITLMWLIKGNMLSFFRNGGSPDKMYILPKEIAGSKNHRYLIDRLTKYKKIENKHGNMVFTGDLDVKDLQGNPKDMEYKDLALYITSNFAFAVGMSSSDKTDNLTTFFNF